MDLYFQKKEAEFMSRYADVLARLQGDTAHALRLEIDYHLFSLMTDDQFSDLARRSAARFTAIAAFATELGYGSAPLYSAERRLYTVCGVELTRVADLA